MRRTLTPRPQSNTFNKLNHFLQLWLEKLCDEHLQGAELKRSRNIYLTRVACQMLEPDSALSSPFDKPPPEGKLTAAEITFKLEVPDEKVRFLTAIGVHQYF